MIQLLLRLLHKTRHQATMRWLVPALFFVGLFCYATTGYMYFEIETKPDLAWIDAAWWSVVTMTTVGYGDYFPESFYGRLFVGVPTMLLGVSLLGYILSLLASLIVEVRFKELRGMAQITFSNHILICRYPGVGTLEALLNEIRTDPLTRDAAIVLMDEELDELPVELQRKHVHFVRGQLASEETLSQANFAEAQCAILLQDLTDPANSDAKNLPIALTMERLQPKVVTIVHCCRPENRAFFEHANVDSIVCTEALSAQFIVQEMQDPGVHAVLSELTSNTAGSQCYIVPPPPGATSYGEVRRICVEKQIVPLGLRRDKTNLLAPADDIAVEPEDRVVLVAKQRPVFAQ